MNQNKYGDRSNWDNEAEFADLKGKTILKVEQNGDEELVFYSDNGKIYRLWYDHDCCASCSIEDICGELSDLENSPILFAEEISSTEPDATLLAKRKADYEKEKAEFKPRYEGEEFYHSGPKPENNWHEESETWTFYKISTIKGSVTIRWYGQSNGFYSESATFEEVAQ